MSDAPPAYDEVKHNPIYPDASIPPMPSPQPQYQPQTANLGHPSQNPQHPHPNQYDQHQPGSRVVYVADTHHFGPKPAVMTCPHCQQQIQTRVEYASGLLAWLICGGCVLFGCVLGCCLIPFCVDECKDAEHYCPSCSAFVGNYKRIG